jgi:hypothetical protein
MSSLSASPRESSSPLSTVRSWTTSTATPLLRRHC